MKKLIIVAVILNLGLIIHAQNVGKKINQIFNEWNIPGHPGGVVAIMKKGELDILKAYGQADIKYNIPNTAETIFNVGSVSKQFTAIGIVLLHLDGKLSFDDDIRKYLPELHDFENKITLRHLLHHTSGFRSTPELFALAGWRDGDAITSADNYRYFCKQTGLNFKPGTQFMYSNSNYILLAKIIEKVSGQQYKDWITERIFLPLGMSDTFVDETNSNSHPKVPSPYIEIGPKHFIKAENSSLDYGASNIYTTATDLANWMKNFHSPTKGWEKAFELLQTRESLENGQANDYAFGVMVDDFYGNDRIQHTGGVPGFMSFVAHFPDEEITIVLLTNFISPMVNERYMMLSQLFLKNRSPKPQRPKPVKQMSLDKAAAAKISGDYWNNKEHFSRKIYLENDTLWYHRTNGTKSPLIQTAKNQFVMGGVQAHVSVHFEPGHKNRMILKDGNKPPLIFEQYDSSPLSQSEKEAYSGKFYSAELETNYTISLSEGQLMGYHSKHGKFPIEILKRDVTNWSGLAIVRYERNEKGAVTGFYVSLNRVENVWFQRVDD